MMHGLLHALGALLVLPYAMLAGAFLMIGEVARARGMAAVFDVLLNQADWMLRWGIYAIPLACCALVVMGFVPRLRRAGLFCLGLLSAVSLLAICGLGATPIDLGGFLFLVPCLSVLATSVLMLIRSRRIPGAGRTLPALVALLLSSSALIGLGHASDAAAATAAQTRDLPAMPSATGANSMSWDRGDPMRVREANPNDAASLLALLERLAVESSYLEFEPGEFTVTAEAYARRMATGAEQGSWVMFVAETEDGLIGCCWGLRGQSRRTRHAMTFGLGIERAAWGRGIGGALLGAIETWGAARGATRLELTVQPSNARARRLYERMGFALEGVKRNARRIDGAYVDEILMSRLLEA